jgi:CoA:oxalate CoA-transferase
MTQQSPSGRPLEGVTIVESSSYLTGPLTSLILHDLGAQVIKVEPPGGEGFRNFGHKKNGWSAVWTSANRGKRSVVLDLKTSDGLAGMKQLLENADVLIENWRPHVADSLGLGGQIVRDLNPAIVRLSITGYGSTGPLAGAPAFDPLIQGRTGMAHIADSGAGPKVAPYWIVDKVVATFGVQAVLAALVQRSSTGVGSDISLPMLDVMTYFNFPDLMQYRTFVGDNLPWTPFVSPVVRTQDGFLIISPVSGAQMSRTLKAIGRVDVKQELLAITDPVRMAERFYACLGETLQTRSSAYWLQTLEAADLPVAPVLDIDEHMSDAQVVHNRLFHEIDSAAGPVRVVRYPAAFDGQILVPTVAPSLPGEHTEEIFVGKPVEKERK